MVPLADLTVDDLEVSDDPTEGIEDGVKDQALEWPVGISCRGRDALNDSTQDVVYTKTRLTAGTNDFFALAAE